MRWVCGGAEARGVDAEIGRVYAAMNAGWMIGDARRDGKGKSRWDGSGVDERT